MLQSTIRNCLVVTLCLTATLGGGRQASAQTRDALYIPIEIAGGTQVSPSAVNDWGTVIGTYLDANLSQHGFVRNIFGTITSFDIPGSFATYPIAINDRGAITGTYLADGVGAGFVRSADGKIETFNVNGSNSSTYPRDINDRGLVVGTYSNNMTIPPLFAFLRHPDGSIVTFSVPENIPPFEIPPIDELVPASVNNKGEIAGRFSGNGGSGGFVRSPDGDITQFGANEGTTPYAINDAGIISGSAYGTGGASGFVRSASGDITLIEGPHGGVVYTQNEAVLIDQLGEIVGAYSVPSSTRIRGFLRSPDGKESGFSFPEAVVTLPTGISHFGIITGTYTKQDGILRGFLRIPWFCK